jgi:DNA-binding MarR family transcriptional regulator
MATGNDLVSAVWAAINLETMISRAWSDCFPKYPDLKFDEYRQIVLLVLLYAALHPMECTPSRVQKIISDNFLLDHKTVQARIQRLVDDKFLVVQSHPEDRRKKLIQPTDKLLVAFARFNGIILQIVLKMRAQMATAGKFENVNELDSHLHFNIFDYFKSESDDTEALGADSLDRGGKS